MRLLTSALFGLALAVGAGAQTGPLFPEPFQVEHHLVQDDGDGNRFTGEPVVDTYGGSWIVSQRPDGSRLIVDLERREITEVRTADGTYSVVSFDRFAELQARLRAAQGLGKAEEPPKKAAAAASVVVTEAQGAMRGVSGQAGLSGKADVRRLRVSQGNSPALEVWVDPSVRLTPAALAAMDALESAASGRREDAPGRLVSAARSHAGGAVPVRTVRPLATSGRVEDVTTRLERLERFPAELVQIPEGLRRVPHPLEAAVRFLEEDRKLDAAMAAQPK